ncbi:hypothetical protein GCM10027578_22220 [Spirosoma luteolum]
MATLTYNADQRGKLVKAPSGDSVRLFYGPETAKKLAEFITGPATIGTATGKTYNDGTYTYTEVLRAANNPFVPTVQVVYVIATDVTLATNPDYDPAKDTDRPADATTSPVSGADSADTDDVSDTPGPGRVPVVAANGKTVYVLVPQPESTSALQTVQNVVTGNDPNRKWLTYGLYGVLGLAAVALALLMIRKPKPALAK